MSDVGVFIIFFGSMATMLAMSWKPKCDTCGERDYIHHCKKGGGSWIAK